MFFSKSKGTERSENRNRENSKYSKKNFKDFGGKYFPSAEKGKGETLSKDDKRESNECKRKFPSFSGRENEDGDLPFVSSSARAGGRKRRKTNLNDLQIDHFGVFTMNSYSIEPEMKPITVSKNVKKVEFYTYDIEERICEIVKRDARNNVIAWCCAWNTNKRILETVSENVSACMMLINDEDFSGRPDILNSYRRLPKFDKPFREVFSHLPYCVLRCLDRTKNGKPIDGKISRHAMALGNPSMNFFSKKKGSDERSEERNGKRSNGNELEFFGSNGKNENVSNSSGNEKPFIDPKLPIMHNKFFVIFEKDSSGRDRPFSVFLSSFNCTEKAKRNLEFGIYVEDPIVSEGFFKYFCAMMVRGKPIAGLYDERDETQTEKYAKNKKKRSFFG